MCVCIVSMHPPSLDFAEDARDRDALEKAKIRCRGVRVVMDGAC